MKLHANAALSLKGRRQLCRRVVDEGWPVTEAASAVEVSVRCARKWVGRFRAEGELGLLDRSSVPSSMPHRTSEQRTEAIAALRRLRMTGPEIAAVLGMVCSSVSGALKRIGLGKLSRLEPPEPPNRYELRHPGELLHIDVKKLGRIERGAGHRATGRRRRNPRKRDGSGIDRSSVSWECVHVCVDDYSRLAYAQVLGDEKATSAIAFLRAAVSFYAAHAVKVTAVMTDNGSAYISVLHAVACRALGMRHIRIQPRRPATNGKAERFIRTMLREWAYGVIYASSTQRAAALAGWLERYNTRRPHGSLGHKPPISLLTGTNLLGSYRRLLLTLSTTLPTQRPSCSLGEPIARLRGGCPARHRGATGDARRISKPARCSALGLRRIRSIR
jgi:transposase InsO family protein